MFYYSKIIDFIECDIKKAQKKERGNVREIEGQVEPWDIS